MNYSEYVSTQEGKEEIMTALKLLVDVCHGRAKEGGWWHDLETGEPKERNSGELLMLMVSEIAEAMEGNRKNLFDDHLPCYRMETVEIADLLIRAFDYIGGMDLDVENALPDKLEYNVHREDHKKENRLAENGKKY